MFTGLIEDIGSISKKSNNYLVIETILDGIKRGDSISVNGVCLTATDIKFKYIKFDVMPETFKKSNLSLLKTNDKVNLERAMTLNDRFGGHIVQGHSEGMVNLKYISKNDNSRILTFAINKQDKNIFLNIIEKGSVAINGVSLTVLSKIDSKFSVSIIPETWDKTNFAYYKIGSLLNIETDILTKKNINKTSNIMNLLMEEGFV